MFNDSHQLCTKKVIPPLHMKASFCDFCQKQKHLKGFLALSSEKVASERKRGGPAELKALWSQMEKPPG